jgi:hypothetical protein
MAPACPAGPTGTAMASIWVAVSSTVAAKQQRVRV